jgi:hypothetical protein
MVFVLVSVEILLSVDFQLIQLKFQYYYFYLDLEDLIFSSSIAFLLDKKF